MGKVFEEICKQYLWKLLLDGKSPVEFSDLGRWWGSNPKTKAQEEIDIVGAADKTTALFAECKWTNEKVDLPVLEKLIDRSKLLHYPNKYYYLFSKTGFTKGCMDGGVLLGNIVFLDFLKIL